MTVFELMPAIWICCAFFFAMWLIIFDIDISAVGISSSLVSLFLSLFSFPISYQCGAFFIWGFILIMLSIPGKKVKNTAVAVTKVDRFGGVIKYAGKCRLSYSRDVTHEYAPGDTFTVSGNETGFSD